MKRIEPRAHPAGRRSFAGLLSDWADALAGDLRHSVRALRRSPGFTTVLVAVLALGIGGNTTVFSLVYGILARPLPYSDPSRLVLLASQRPGELASEPEWSRTIAFSRSEFERLQAGTRTFEGLAIWSTSQYSLPAPSETIAGTVVSSRFFPLLRVRPSLGRCWQAEEDGTPVAVISHRLWRQRFGADPTAVGRTLAINGVAHTILGVLPREFALPSKETDLWLPFEAGSRLASTEFRSQGVFPVMGRLKSRVTLAQADQDLRVVADAIEGGRRARGIASRQILAVPLADELVRGVRLPLLVLLGFAGLVLLAACANVMNLVLARGAARMPELALRRVLGASAGRLLQRQLIEGLILGVLGATVGSLLAFVGLPSVIRLCPPGMPRLEAVRVDSVVLAFALATGLAAALLCAGIPAIIVARRLSHRLSTLDDRSVSPRALRWQGVFLVAEVALSMAVLVGAGLLAGGLVRLLTTPTGIDTADVVTGRVNLPPNRYAAPLQQRDFFNRAIEEIRRIPGVEVAGVGTSMPPDRSYGTLGFMKRDDATGEVQTLNLELAFVTPGYLEALKVPLLAGRRLTARDVPDAPRVALVSERAAKLLFGSHGFWSSDGSVIGQTLSMGRREGTATIVGVVGDVRYSGLDQAPHGAVYIPFAQRPFHRTYLAIRSPLPPSLILPRVRAAVASVDAAQEVLGLQPLEDVLADTVLQPRLRAFLAAMLGGLAFALALLGIYGTTAYWVSLRTRDLAVRRALGASGLGICWAVMKRSLILFCVGAAVGIVIAAGFSTILGHMVLILPAADWLAFGAAALGLGSIALVGALTPAWRALRIDPAQALRSE